MRKYWQSVVGDWVGDWTRNWAEDWRPVSRYSVAAWLFVYAVFLLYAFSKHGEFLFIDLANLVVHEGGHLLLAADLATPAVREVRVDQPRQGEAFEGGDLAVG